MHKQYASNKLSLHKVIRILYYRRHVTNVTVRATTGPPAPVSSLIRGSRLRLFGTWYDRIQSRITAESLVRRLIPSPVY